MDLSGGSVGWWCGSVSMFLVDSLRFPENEHFGTFKNDSLKKENHLNHPPPFLGFKMFVFAGVSLFFLSKYDLFFEVIWVGWLRVIINLFHGLGKQLMEKFFTFCTIGGGATIVINGVITP